MPVPGYRLTRHLGSGQFGEVWEATVPGKVKVAMKIIDLRRCEGLKEATNLEKIKDIRSLHLVNISAMFRTDENDDLIHGSASSLARLDANPSGTVMFDAAKQAVTLFVVMDLGEENLLRLERYQKQGQIGIPSVELLEYMAGAARGIDYLNKPIHDLGSGPTSVVHGDIKPQNMLIVGGELKICDFGLAREAAKGTDAGTIVCTPEYAAPELTMGLPHAKSDQYCLAVSYFHLRTGALPLGGDTGPLAMIRHQKGRSTFPC